MKKFLVALVLLGTSFFVNADIVTVPIPGAPGLSVTVGTGVNALPLQNIRNNPNAVNITQGDDDYTHVPLGFNFPMYGRTFSNSWAMTNGMVTFQDPAVSGIYGACCSGVDLSRTTDTRWNYSIFGVHSDLYSWNGQNQYYLRGNNEMTYGWYNVSQCCSSQGGNSFEIKINSAGVIDTRIAGAMVQWNAVTSGFSGDLSKGEYYQHYYGQGWNIPNGSGISWGAFGGTGGGDVCTTNPLSSPSCPNYFSAQCTVSPLYNPSCPGYATAYYTQQCSTNPLYDVNCPGYATAYLDYQCSIDPLYSTTCSGYTQAYHDQQCRLNPLFANDCNGYQTAYHDQQCSINPLYATDCIGYGAAYLTQQCNLNPLYSTQCSGYAAAYKTQQCSINPLYATDCPGYAAAYKTQQCTLNPLYATDCPGYAVAYKTQQCTISPLYATDCPGYATAYFDQQCKLNGLYDQKCPNYADAYAKKMVLEQQGMASTVATAGVVAATAPKQEPTTTSTDSSGEVKVAVVADSNVNNVIQTTATSASPAQAATATVPLVAAPPAPAAAVAAPVEAKQDNKNAPSSSVPPPAAPQGSPQDSPKPTARQELQAKREAAAKAKAVEEGKNLAGNMGKVADMEQQKQVQNVVIQAMGFTPGFDAYGKVTVPDSKGYKPYSVYSNQKNVDNRRVGFGLFGPTDKLHNELVDSQYNYNQEK